MSSSNQVESIDGATVVKSSPSKLYNFFKFNMNDLVKLLPTVFTGVQIIQGQEGTVGCVKNWNYNLEGKPLSAKVKLSALDDYAKSITFSVLEGDLLLLYKSFAATYAFSEGLAKCTLTYEKATPLSPPPESYLALFISVFTVVDAYLLTT